ncbi:hypothetical protein NDA03_03180 [Trichocoleus sp. Lan]
MRYVLHGIDLGILGDGKLMEGTLGTWHGSAPTKKNKLASTIHKNGFN